MMDDAKGRPEARISWEGDSLGVLRGFPPDVRSDVGSELRRLQTGERPLHSRPMPSVGPKAYEIREQDARAWYRVIYLARLGDVIYVLHCFEKKSRKTPRADLDLARRRLRNVLLRRREESQP